LKETDECKSYRHSYLNFFVHLYENYISYVDMLAILSLKDEGDNPQCEIADTGPLILNAFDMIMLSQGLNLATIFDRGQVFT